MARARRRWMRKQGVFDPARLVFIDETSTSTTLCFCLFCLFCDFCPGASHFSQNLAMLSCPSD